MKAPSFQEMIMRLERFWADKGCLIWHPYNYPVGAGTMNPATFLRVLGPEPWNVGYVEPSIRPDDGRYGENPNRMQLHTQYQVILKPAPDDCQELYLQSLDAIGIDRARHDIRFVEDNWQSPALGAWGLGWEVWLDGLEITQFTYFQQAGGQTLDPNSVELTYGLERIAMFLQGVREVWQLDWDGNHTYGDVYLQPEIDFCKYQFETADVKRLTLMYDEFEKEAKETIERGLIDPAYNYVLFCSHLFNILDARGGIGVTERATYFARMRGLARKVAEKYVEKRREMNYPLLRKDSGKIGKKPAAEIPAPSSSTDKYNDFLLEIGTEELPPGDVTRAIKQLSEVVPKLLEEAHLGFIEVKVTGTPRRLVVMVSNLERRQPDRVIKKRGPRAERAFDEGGNPTKAGQGFARGQGIAVEDLIIEDGFIFAVRTEVGQSSNAVLPECLKNIVSSLKFEMSMRWNESGAFFSRPIRWFVAIHGADPIFFEACGVQSGKSSRSLRDPGARKIPIEKVSDYGSVMKENGIIFDLAARREEISRQIKERAEEVGGEIPIDNDLLDEVTGLVEDPMAIPGNFEEEYLRLPKEVLIKVMRKHQRYFPVVKDGKMLPNFVVVANGGHLDKDLVRKGNEGVLRARFADAAYFVDKDRKTPLSTFTGKLSKLTFQTELGNYLDKVKRIEVLTKTVGEKIGLSSEEIITAQKMASLCKSDLATDMVIEMTSLQGIMGREYYLEEGGDPEVAEGIFEHYLPRYAGDKLPESRPAIAVGIADRLDTLTGLFAVGMSPTGSKDPYALRRSAIGLIQVLHHHGISIHLGGFVEKAAELMPLKIDKKAINETIEFIARRLEALLQEAGHRPDVIRAILVARGDNPHVAWESVEELDKIVAPDDWKEVLFAYSRCKRIVRKIDEEYPLNPNLYVQDETRKLHESAMAAREKITSGSSPSELVSVLEGLKDTINTFFDNVLVMCEDEKLSRNRLALIQRIASLPDGIADMSLLEGF